MTDKRKLALESERKRFAKLGIPTSLPGKPNSGRRVDPVWLEARWIDPKKIECSVCNKKFKQTRQLQNHFNAVHAKRLALKSEGIFELANISNFFMKTLNNINKNSRFLWTSSHTEKVEKSQKKTQNEKRKMFSFCNRKILNRSLYRPKVNFMENCRKRRKKTRGRTKNNGFGHS